MILVVLLVILCAYSTSAKTEWSTVAFGPPESLSLAMAECSLLTFVCLVLPRLVLSFPPFSEHFFPSGTILDRLLRPGDKEQLLFRF